MRLNEKGIKMIKIRDAVLYHSLGESKTIKGILGSFNTSNHSALRRYYMTRNRFYIWEKYKGLNSFTLNRDKKLFKKEFLLKSNNLIYFILFPCDLTRENFENILTNPSLELKKKIEHFYQNNIDWVKIRNTTGELDYSKQFLRNAYVKKKIS